MFFIAYAFKGQVHDCVCRTSDCKSLVLQDKCNIEIFFVPSDVSYNVSANGKLSRISLTKKPNLIMLYAANDLQVASADFFQNVGA